MKSQQILIGRIAREGVIVKGCKDVGYENFIGVSIRLEHENTRFLDILDQMKDMTNAS